VLTKVYKNATHVDSISLDSDWRVYTGVGVDNSL